MKLQLEVNYPIELAYGWDSAADLFAAGFADNGIGTVISVGRATGAGGANVWWADTLNGVLAGTRHQLPRLPKGVGFTLSVRRATRIGASDGAPIEDVGIVGHRTYAMTRDDLLKGNLDLLNFCGRLLEAAPATSLAVQWNAPTLTVDVGKLDRIERADALMITAIGAQGDDEAIEKTIKDLNGP